MDNRIKETEIIILVMKCCYIFTIREVAFTNRIHKSHFEYVLSGMKEACTCN